MREASGQSFKSSILHTWLRDTRDNKLTGTRGFYTKITQELAGLGGDAKFHKLEAEGQLSRPIIPGVVRLSNFCLYCTGLRLTSSGYRSLHVPDTCIQWAEI